MMAASNEKRPRWTPDLNRPERWPCLREAAPEGARCSHPTCAYPEAASCPNCGCPKDDHRHGGIGVCSGGHGCEDTRPPCDGFCPDGRYCREHGDLVWVDWCGAARPNSNRVCYLPIGHRWPWHLPHDQVLRVWKWWR